MISKQIKRIGEFYASTLIISDIIELGGRLANPPVILRERSDRRISLRINSTKNLDPSPWLRVTKGRLPELVVWGLAESKFRAE